MSGATKYTNDRTVRVLVVISSVLAFVDVALLAYVFTK